MPFRSGKVEEEISVDKVEVDRTGVKGEGEDPGMAIHGAWKVML